MADSNIRDENDPAIPPSSKQAEAGATKALGTLASGAGDTSFNPESLLNPQAEKKGIGIAVEFGRYRIIRELGAGAMGTVYLAEDTQLHRRVALKVPQLGNQQDSSRLERFYREARLAATLSHPNICPIHDVGSHDGTHFISMAFVQGRPLAAHLKGAKPVPERTAASLIRKLALALHEAHTHGVIHRDLKPANVMIDQRGEPIVMDFGLARQAAGHDEAQITQSGVILGTPAYMSPEQVRGETESVGAPADQYALGVILYQMLSGRLPFEGPVVSVLMQIATQSPAPLSSHRPDIPADLEAICLRAMSREPKDRFANTAELAGALTQFVRQSVVASQGVVPVKAVKSGVVAKARSAPTGIADLHSQSMRVAPTADVGPAPARPSFLGGSRYSTKRLAALAGLAALVFAALAFFVLPKLANKASPSPQSGGIAGLASSSNDVGPAPARVNAVERSEGDPAAEKAAPTDGSHDGPLLAGGPGSSGGPPDRDNLDEISNTPNGDGVSAQAPVESEASAVTDEDSEPESVPQGTVIGEAVAGEGPEDLADTGSKGRKPTRSPVDFFPVGSVWKGKTRQWYRGDKIPKDFDFGIQVLERDKGTFRIRYWGKKLSLEVSGTIRNNQIEWNTENAKVTGGTIGKLQFNGNFSNANRLELQFRGQSFNGQGTNGSGSYHRQN